MARPNKIAAVSRQLATRASEDFHQLLQAIKPEDKSEDCIVALLTSSRSGEGVTTVAVSFGHFLAEMYNQERIALLEANFRKPQFQKLFGLPTSPSLLEVLTNRASMEEACFNIGSDALIAIHAGTGSTARDLLSTEGPVKELGQQIEKLKKTCKFIILDTPPVIQYVDAAIIAGAADGVALIVEANNTRAEVVNRSCDRLKRSGTHILGMILNKRQFHIPGWIYRFL
jgi:Mrp family chromosome partitioning ATPase